MRLKQVMIQENLLIKIIANFKRQIKMLGLSYDWTREIATCDPEYFKWTQWIFVNFIKKDLPN